MQIGSKVICAYAGHYPHITTHQEYEVVDVTRKGTYITIKDANGEVQGSYLAKRFMYSHEVIKQVQENAKHG